VEDAVARLLRLGLARRDERGELKACSDFWDTPQNIPSAALKKVHLQLLEKASESIAGDPVSERTVRSVVLSVSSKKFGEVQRKVNRFHEKLIGDLSKDRDRDRVYGLCMTYFPLDRRGNLER